VTPLSTLLDVQQGAAVVASGGIVVYPTETLWGLGGNARDSAVAARVRAIKMVPSPLVGQGTLGTIPSPLVGQGRSGGPAPALSTRPFAVLVDSRERFLSVVSGDTPGLRNLVARFWPGALTIAVPTSDAALLKACGKDGRVAFRLSANPVACRLAEACGGFLISTSANFSGARPPASLCEVAVDLVALTAGCVALSSTRRESADACGLAGSGPDPAASGRGEAPWPQPGESSLGVASTLIAWDGDCWRVERDGAVPRQRLAEVVQIDTDCEVTPFFEGALVCHQPRDGYRFSVDSLLLAHFVLTSGRAVGRFLDLGAGCGVISLLLAKAQAAHAVLRHDLAAVRCSAPAGILPGPASLAVEIQELLARCCKETLDSNGASGLVRAIRADVRSLRGVVEPGRFDTVVSNPPYHPAASSRDNAAPETTTARHEVACTMSDVLSAARLALPEGGRLFLTYPASRLDELLAALPLHKLKACRLRMVHSLPGRDAGAFLLEAVKSRARDLVVEPPLITHAEGGAYAAWYAELRRLCLGPGTA